MLCRGLLYDWCRCLVVSVSCWMSWLKLIPSWGCIARHKQFLLFGWRLNVDTAIVPLFVI